MVKWQSEQRTFFFSFIFEMRKRLSVYVPGYFNVIMTHRAIRNGFLLISVKRFLGINEMAGIACPGIRLKMLFSAKICMAGSASHTQIFTKVDRMRSMLKWRDLFVPDLSRG